jgi:hypothetical protein
VLAASTAHAKLSVKLTHRKTGTPSLAVKATAAAGAKLRSVRVTLAKGMTVHGARVKKLAVTGGSAKATSGRTILVTLRGTGRRTASATLRGGTLTLSSAVRRTSSKLTVKLVLTYAGGVVERRTVTIK